MQLRRALLISTADRYVGMVVNFAQLAIIARLMTPDEFGVAVIGTAITSIAIAVREFASQVYLINRPRLSLTTIRACFTLMMLTTLLIVAVILAMAPWMEAWYDRPGLALYLGLIGVALLLEPFSQMIVGLLRRDLAFGKVAVVNIVNVVVNAAMLVVLVGHGVGFTAFGWAWVACALASVLVAIALRPDLSVFRPSLRGLRDAVRFGAYNGAAALLYRVYEAGPLFALGQMLSFNELGLFYRTLTLAQLPDKVVLSGVTAVALPAFSQAAREGRDLTTAYLRAVTLITAVQWPALACMATMAEGVVHVVLGDTWMAVAPLLRIMAVASLFAFTSELNYPVLVATGAMRQNLRRALIAWPGSAAIIMGFAVFGLHAVVLSFLVVIPFQALVSVLAVRHSLSLSTRKLFGAVGRSAVVTGITVLGPLTVMALQPTHTVMSPWALFVSLLLAMLAWLAALRLTRHPAWQEILRLLPARAPAGRLVAVAGARD